jgi:hypothetical protein
VKQPPLSAYKPVQPGAQFVKTTTLMSKTEMKKELISRIEAMEDEGVLEEVYRILGINTGSVDTVVLSGYQQSAIDAGLKDIENGNTLTDDEANRDIEQWLKK